MAFIVRVALVGFAVAGVLNAATPAWQVAERDTRPRFDVASIRACTSNAPGTRGAAPLSPGRLRIDCRSFFDLMRMAYQVYAGGRVNAPGTYPTLDPFNYASPRAPAWTGSMTFTIEAISEQTPPPSPTMMRGPMLQTLLEERFKLKMHRESREMSVYEMVVGKGGVKVKRFQPGTCVPYDWSVDPQPPLESGKRRCLNRGDRDAAGTSWVETAEATTLDELAETITNNARALALAGIGDGRPVINRTGINGLVSYRLVYTDHDAYIAGIKDQLGLDLRPARAMRDFLVIDHVEQPATNQ